MGLVAACLVVFAAIVMYKQTMHSSISPTAYAPLLAVIAKGESNGNYNAYFGNAANTAIRFTDMPVDDVLRWQDEHVRLGNVSSAVGKYQIIRPTLAGLVQELDIQPQVRFDEALQDRMAIALLERRGAVAYARQELTRDEFAANLAKEWAALPRVIGGNAEESYYSSDGINKSHIPIEEIYAALAAFQNRL